uniref:Uncharacterized protein n=1 Tax=Rhizophora mucronata TaxID=61149 RepID=A0A2P2R203_RHIMU
MKLLNKMQQQKLKLKMRFPPDVGVHINWTTKKRSIIGYKGCKEK